jgi:hypothetical protein
MDEMSQQWDEQPEGAEPRGEGAPPEGEAMPEIHVEDMLLYTIGEFANFAWVHLGLQANPLTKETREDLPQARLAIDAASALAPLLEGRVDPHIVRDVNNLVGSLRLNYIQRLPPAE